MRDIRDVIRRALTIIPAEEEGVRGDLLRFWHQDLGGIAPELIQDQGFMAKYWSHFMHILEMHLDLTKPWEPKLKALINDEPETRDLPLAAISG